MSMVNRAVAAGLVAALASAACSSSPGIQQEVAAAPSTSAATSPSTAPHADALPMGQQSETEEGNVVQMIAFVQPVSPGVIEPDPGMEFAAVEAEICAGARGARRVTPDAISVEMPDGRRRGRAYLGPKEPALADAKLGGGACVRGWVSFEVPTGQRPAYVVFQGSSVLRWSAGGRARVR